MAKIGINTKGIGKGMQKFLPAALLGSMCVAIISFLGIMAYETEQAKSERKAAEELQETTATSKTINETYELLTQDIVRIEEEGITHDFQFATGHIYVLKEISRHEDESFIIPFSEVAQPEWIDEIRLKGCEIAARPVIQEENGIEITAEIMEKLEARAEGFLQRHCGEAPEI